MVRATENVIAMFISHSFAKSSKIKMYCIHYFIGEFCGARTMTLNVGIENRIWTGEEHIGFETFTLEVVLAPKHSDDLCCRFPVSTLSPFCHEEKRLEGTRQGECDLHIICILRVKLLWNRGLLRSLWHDHTSSLKQWLPSVHLQLPNRKYVNSASAVFHIKHGG